MMPGVGGRSTRSPDNRYAKMIMQCFRKGWAPDEETAKQVVAAMALIISTSRDDRAKANAANALIRCAEFCSKEQVDQARLELDREKFEAAKSGALGEGLSGGEMRGSDGQPIEP
jgi:hypothetical protein